MQQNYFNPYQMHQYPPQGPNAVNINIISPQAYGSGYSGVGQNYNPYGYNLYGQNNNPALPMYPQNYNNLGNYGYPQQFPNGNYVQNPILNRQNNNGQDYNNTRSGYSETNLVNKTDVPTETKNDKEKTKKVVPLTNEYVMSLENYMNDANPKVRLIGTKELLERFKETETRKDNPSLVPLLNKALQDPSPSVRFLALTALQLGYSVGNNETVTILKNIQAQNKDKFGEDALLASEILLKLAGGEKTNIQMTENEILQAQEKANKKS